MDSGVYRSGLVGVKLTDEIFSTMLYNCSLLEDYSK